MDNLVFAAKCTAGHLEGSTGPWAPEISNSIEDHKYLRFDSALDIPIPGSLRMPPAVTWHILYKCYRGKCPWVLHVFVTQPCGRLTNYSTTQIRAACKVTAFYTFTAFDTTQRRIHVKPCPRRFLTELRRCPVGEQLLCPGRVNSAWFRPY